MIAPLVGDHRTAGVLIVGDRTGVGGRFSTDELRLLETLASHTGAALEQGRLGRQVDELRDLQRALEHQAFHDPLTGLANRLLFSDRVGNALARRSGNAAVMYIDLDDFKGVNDTLGHEAGDALLVAVGDRLRDALRAADTPARLGGDEFAVLLVDISEENARTVANRILSFLARPLDVGGGERPIRASLGLALGDAGTTSVEQLLRNADAAMYAAKHRGKHQLAVHRPAAVAA
jgi:diguanylate cyclase (GGDEF)-like protein